MSASNRPLNRILLALIGLASIASGAWIMLRAYPQLVPVVALPEIALQPDPLTTTIVVAAAVLVIVLALAWILTRGGGKTRRLLHDAHDDGSVEFDVAVARDILTAALQRQPDVLSLHVSSHTVRSTGALRITVAVRQGCDLPRLRDDVARATEQFDRAVERSIPVLLHVTSGVRANFAREQRVA